MITKKCEICGADYKVHRYRVDTAKTCSAECRGAYAGRCRRENARPIIWSGYYFIKWPEHYRANKQGYVKKADMVLEAKLNRKLELNEIAHHINGNKLDDSYENLEVMDNLEHTRMHHEQRKKRENEYTCKVCGNGFRRTGRKKKPSTCSLTCRNYSLSRQFRLDQSQSS